MEAVHVFWFLNRLPEKDRQVAEKPLFQACRAAEQWHSSHLKVGPGRKKQTFTTTRISALDLENGNL